MAQVCLAPIFVNFIAVCSTVADDECEERDRVNSLLWELMLCSSHGVRFVMLVLCVVQLP